MDLGKCAGTRDFNISTQIVAERSVRNESLRVFVNFNIRFPSESCRCVSGIKYTTYKRSLVKQAKSWRY